MKESCYNLKYSTFFKIIDNLYDEIWVYDDKYTIIYVNKACKRHYGFDPEDIIGKNFFDLENSNWWAPSILPHVYEEKKLYAIKQTTFLGCELTNIATPIFDEDGELLFVAMSIRDSLEDKNLFHPGYSKEDMLDVGASQIMYSGKSMQAVMRLANKVSKVDSTCLITGESGTGKTMLAKYIHASSSRKSKPLVNINCSSIPAELIESELFGYRKGAFTGAKAEGRIGLLESADGGTVLFDEVSELPYTMQSKLLHVIQEKEFFPVGSSTPVKVDIKILAATNRNLEGLAAAGSFREDLYYRLNIFEIYMPPLRERGDDIEQLIFYFLNEFGEKYEMRHEISAAVLDILKNYSWRGNIRQLSHIIERLVVTTDDIVIDKKHLPASLFEYRIEDKFGENHQFYSSFDDAVSAFEKKLIVEAYNKYKSTRGVAEALSISQTKASNLIRKYVKQCLI